MSEIWKPILGYENYQVSSFGRVKNTKFNKEILLKAKTTTKYLTVNLYKDNVKKTRNIHQLVAIAFLGHNPNGCKLVINHINFNSFDNTLENLEIVTSRENGNKKHIKSSSKYTGVSWCKKSKKFRSVISINNKNKYLGIFENEIDAHNAYQKALKEITKKTIL